MVGAKAELPDAGDESDSDVVALVLDSARDADRDTAKTIATDITIRATTVDTWRQLVDNRRLARRICAFGVKHPPHRRTVSLDL